MEPTSNAAVASTSYANVASTSYANMASTSYTNVASTSYANVDSSSKQSADELFEKEIINLDHINIAACVTVESETSPKRKRDIEQSGEEDVDLSAAKCLKTNNDVDSVSYDLFSLFVEYAQNSMDDGSPTEKVKDLLDWLKEENITITESGWYTREDLEIWKSLADSIVAVDLLLTIRDVIHLLMYGHDDINYTDESGQTLLHAFVAHIAKRGSTATPKLKAKDRKLVKKLIEKGASVDTVDVELSTAIHDAIMIRRRDLMRLMLPSFNNVDAQDCRGNTILHTLLIVGMNSQHLIDDVKLIIEKGINLDLKNHQGWAPIHYIVHSGNVPLIQLFRRIRANFEIRTYDDETPLLLFTKYCSDSVEDSELIPLIMTTKCNIEALDCDGNTALHYAVHWRGVESMERLIELNANVNAVNQQRQLRPLHLVFLSGNRECYLDKVKILVYNGADVNAASMDGLTPLHLAMIHGDTEVIQFLVEHGADINYREQYSGFSTGHLLAFRHEVDKMQLLLNYGMDHHAMTFTGLTPLHVAAMVGNLELVILLVNAGANVNCADNNLRFTPLHLAAMHLQESSSMELESTAEYFWNFKAETVGTDHHAVIEFLMDNGAHMNTRNKNGHTPLHFAVMKSANSLIEYLLKFDAIKDVPDKNGQVALQYAMHQDNLEAFAMMLVYGADINDDDISQRIVNSHTLNDVAIDYAISRLEAARLPYSHHYRPYLTHWKIQNAPYYQHLLTEVAHMKLFELCPNVSIYKLLHMDDKCRLDYAWMLPDQLEHEFPIYYQLIKSKCRDSFAKRALVESVKLYWYYLTNNKLTAETFEQVLFHLPNKHLCSLILNLYFND